MIKYSFQNTKLHKLARHLNLTQRQVISFDLPAGWTCAKAGVCKTFSNKETGKIKRVGRIMCYASKVEAYSPSCRRMRWDNFSQLLACKNDVKAIASLLMEAMPKNLKVVRIHSSGDFYSHAYFTAWLEVAKACPDITFFGYTKHFKCASAELPANMFLQYSYGSKDDNQRDASRKKIPTCYIKEYMGQYRGIKNVCGTHDTAYQDFEAIVSKKNFVIAIH